MNSSQKTQTDTSQASPKSWERDRYVQPHMLKISTLRSSEDEETLRLEGHLGGPWVDELRRSCDRVLSKRKGLKLDLSGVAFIDRDGVGLLRTLRLKKVELRNCSPFVALQVEEDSVE